MDCTLQDDDTGRRHVFSERFFQRLGECLAGAVVVCRLADQYPILYVNDAFLAQLNYEREEFLAHTGGRYLHCVHPEDRERLATEIDAALRLHDSYSVAYRVVQKGGGILWLREEGKKALYEDGQAVLVCVFVDITETIALQQRVKSRNTRLQALIDSLPGGICKVSADDALRLIHANSFFYHMLGYTQEQAQALGFQDMSYVVYPPDLPLVRESVRENVGQAATIFELEHRFLHRSGQVLWGLSRCNYDPAAPGELACVLLDITPRKAMEEQLRLSEEESRIAFQHTDKVMVVYDVMTKTLFQPESAAFELGLPPMVAGVPESIVDIVADESLENFLSFYRNMQSGVPEGRMTVKLKTVRGHQWFSGRYTLICSVEGKPQRAIISYENVTIQREKEFAYQKWCQSFKAQQENSIGYYEFNLTKNIYEGNERRNSGALPANVRSFSETVDYIAGHYVYQEDLPKYLSVFDREKLLGKYYSGQCEIHLEHRRVEPAGRVYWVTGHIQLVPDPYTSDIKAFILIRDIDAQKRQDLEMRNLIEQDALTGLLNRATVVTRVTEILRQSGEGAKHALIMLDLDHFKCFNDSLGHQFGDQVLKDVAGSLKEALRKKDLCGRLGGDEFVLFLRDIPALPELEARLETLRKAAEKEYASGQRISASLGLARYPHDGKTFSDLYRKADMALYEAKRLGRDRYVLYHPGLGT